MGGYFRRGWAVAVSGALTVTMMLTPAGPAGAQTTPGAPPGQDLAITVGDLDFVLRQIEIGELLEPLYQAAGEWERLLSVREGQLAHLESLEERIALYHRMAEDAEERLLDAPGFASPYRLGETNGLLTSQLRGLDLLGQLAELVLHVIDLSG